MWQTVPEDLKICPPEKFFFTNSDLRSFIFSAYRVSLRCYVYVRTGQAVRIQAWFNEVPISLV